MERGLARGHEEVQQPSTLLTARRYNRQQPLSKATPRSLSDPKLPLRYNTAGRKARSETLLVDSTPSIRVKAHHFPLSF